MQTNFGVLPAYFPLGMERGRALTSEVKQLGHKTYYFLPGRREGGTAFSQVYVKPGREDCVPE